MHAKRIMVFGYGKLGSRVAQELALNNEVWVFCRTNKPAFEGVRFIHGDVSDSSSVVNNLPDHLDIVLYCLSPRERSDNAYQSVYVEGLRNILLAFADCSRAPHVFFVSSTSVYHQDDSSVINENSATNPSGFAGRRMLEAESVLRRANLPGTCVRFSGIYGGSRSRLVEQVKLGAAFKSDTLRLTNRIHEDDCVGFLLHLINLVASGETVEDCYIASDDCPVDLNEVIAFIARSYHLDEPLLGPTGARRAGNKRCDNRRMKGTGYALKYPSYRDGYQRLD